MFECNINLSGDAHHDGGEFPADYDSMVVGTSYAKDDNLEYLHNSAISFSQLFQFQSDNLGSQREEEEQMSSPEMEEEDWLRSLLSSEDSFDPDFLDNIDLDSLDQDEGVAGIVEDVSLSASASSVSLSLSQVSEVPEDSSLVELLTEGPGVGLGSQWEEVKEETSSPEEDGEGDWLRNLLSSADSFDPCFLDNIDLDSLDHRSVLEEEEEEERELVESVEVDEGLGYTVEMESIE